MIASAMTGAIGTTCRLAQSVGAPAIVSVIKTFFTASCANFWRAPGRRRPCVAAMVKSCRAHALRSASMPDAKVPPVEIMSSTMRQGLPLTSPTR